GNGIHVDERAEQLHLREVVSMRAVAADAHPHGPGSAALALRLPYGMQDALAHAFEITVRAAQMVEFARDRVLDVLVLAAASFEDQLDFDLVFFPLFEMNHGRLDAEVVAAVLAGKRIDRIRPQLAAPRGLGDGFTDRLA